MALTLLFNLADELYGLEIEAVQEVLEEPQQHFVPQATGVLKGAINFHGQILPVVDLPQLLGFTDQERDQRLMVLTASYHSLTLEVSRVRRIVALDLGLLQPPPAGAGHAAVRGVVSYEDSLVNLLDTEEMIQMLHRIYTT